MAETIKYTAKPRDTFCSIAVKHGFPNCDKLRELPDNIKTFDTERGAKDKWVLKVDDTVHIPKTLEGKDVKATGKQWDFGRPGEPPVSIRLVHGQANDENCAMHPEKKHLYISNYKTDAAGAARVDGKFPNETACGYNADADADDDAFKVEVHDAQTEKNELTEQVSIEALRPRYKEINKVKGEYGELEKWEQYRKDEKDEGRELTKIKAKRMPDDASTAPTAEDMEKALEAKTKQKVRWICDAKSKEWRLLDTDEPVAKERAKLANTRFWTPYLRLVVDEKDWEARKKQTLRIEPILEKTKDAEGAEITEAENKKMEILDHKVRAVYELEACKATPKKWKCKAVCEAEVGDGKKRVKVAIHILRKSRTGAGVATEDKVRDWFLKYLRQFFAQANLSLCFVKKKLKDTEPEKEVIRLVPPPANLFVVSNREGKEAVKDKTIKVDVTVDGHKETVQIKSKDKQKPVGVAKDLADEIRKAFDTALGENKVKVVHSENPAIQGKVGKKSADVLVGDPLEQKIEIKVVTCEDAGYVEAYGIDPSKGIPDFGGDDYHVGTPEERCVLKNYHVKGKHIDVFVVHGEWLGSKPLGGAFGEGFSPGKGKAELKPLEEINNSAIVVAKPAILSDDWLSVTPHELGHILMDDDHVVGEKSEIMSDPNEPGAKFKQEVESMKRLADPDKALGHKEVEYDSGTKGSSTKMIRENNSTLLDSW